MNTGHCSPFLSSILLHHLVGPVTDVSGPDTAPRPRPGRTLKSSDFELYYKLRQRTAVDLTW